jgi:hypothetical protein
VAFRPSLRTTTAVGNRDNGGLGDRVVGHQLVLQRDGRDPLAPALDEIFGPVLYPYVTEIVYRHYVAGLEPAVLGEPVGAFGVVVVGAGDVRPAHLDLAHRLVVPRDEPLVAARPYLDERQRPTRLRHVVVTFVFVLLPDLASEARDGGERARLGHPPTLKDPQAVALREARDHTPRRRRPAHEHRPQRREVVAVGVFIQHLQYPEPDRGYPRRDRHPLVLAKLQEAFGVEVRPREDLPGTGEDGAIGQAPGVRVEHRDHRQDAVRLRDAYRVGEHVAEGVKVDRAVRVHDALGPTRRPARVAHPHRRVLVHVRVRVIVFVGTVQKLLVGDHAVGYVVPALGDNDDVLDVHAVFELFVEREQGLVHDQGPVPCVLDDVRQIIGMEAKV